MGTERAERAFRYVDLVSLSTPTDLLLDPIAVLGTGVDSYRPFLREDGELLDPLVGAPTQYGTPYHAWGNAVLAGYADPERRADRLDAALRGLSAAVAHVADPSLPATWSGFDRAIGSARSNGSHRDFFWPPILKTHLLLRELGADPARLDAVWEQIRGVDVFASFHRRPPSNWAMVWCSGEWIRIREGASTNTVNDFDGWLDTFFDEGFVFDLGLYVERGIPNAYDLFTRVHLADLLVSGYDGRNAERITTFLTHGLTRSLQMQLSDGSVASGYRSTGQTWTLGAQIAFFEHCRTLGLGSAADRADARLASERTLTNLAQWQRPAGEFSPVQNLHPEWRRIGYETYTADGHYASLALAFLATAVHAGFTSTSASIDDLDRRPDQVRVEHEPTFRAAAHRGRISVAVQARADHVYDGNGLVDVTFGAGRLFQIATSARHLGGGPWFNPGLGVRAEPGRTATAVISGLTQRPAGDGLRAASDGGLELETVIEPDEAEHPMAGWAYRLTVQPVDGPDGTGIDVTEATPGHSHHPVLFLPYPADLGAGLRTTVEWTDAGAVLTLEHAGRREELELIIDAEITARLDLDRDYTNRRGECGLLRFDLAGPADQISWRLRSR